MLLFYYTLRKTIVRFTTDEKGTERNFSATWIEFLFSIGLRKYLKTFVCLNSEPDLGNEKYAG